VKGKQVRLNTDDKKTYIILDKILVPCGGTSETKYLAQCIEDKSINIIRPSNIISIT
jgi:hypothetical protein